jgi:hypothetical protein
MQQIHKTLALIIPAGVLFFSSAANAVIVLQNNQSINLGELMGTGSDRKFIIGDKLFTFEYVTTPNFNIQNYDITAKILGQNQYGLNNIAFDMTGPWVDGGINDQTVQDMNLQYTVEVLPEFYERGIRLCDTGLSFNGQAGGTGSFARVAETVFAVDTGQLLGNLVVFDNAGPPRSTQYQEVKDWCDIYGTQGYRAFQCNKNLKFFANTDGGFASASFVRQEFSQIPAPGAFALLGVAGILGARRRR